MKTKTRLQNQPPLSIIFSLKNNSIDWEKVKVAQPSEEEIIATTSATEEEKENSSNGNNEKILVKTTTDTASMIKKEINNLEDDIKQNEQILTWLNKMDDKSVNRGKRLYIPSTLNTDNLLWHTQLILCAVKC